MDGLEINNPQLTETDLQEITRRIVAAANPVKIILFGSTGAGICFSPIQQVIVWL